MDTNVRRKGIDRRTLLLGAGGAGLAATLGASISARFPADEAAARMLATPGATPVAWTAPPIPQPLPTVGGIAPTVVGAAPTVSSAPAATVTLTPDFRFDPAQVTIRSGQAVQWINAGRSPQTVTGDPARVTDSAHVALPAGAAPWDSGVLNAGEPYVQIFAVPGDYTYVSIPQEQAGMTGHILVQG
ncbi:MAG: hypothetical protein KC442_14165 [Thermomicrobiales bacterium]|nr:hypothetical protein [Thermomicrobiales bacterium]